MVGIGPVELIVIFAVVVTPIATLMLRGSVALANRIIGPVDPLQNTDKAGIQPESILTDDTQQSEPSARDMSNPFSAPTTSSTLSEVVGDGRAIPTPGFFRALAIVVIQWIAATIVSTFVGMMIDLSIDVTLTIGMIKVAIEWLVMFLIASLIFRQMAPTTFPRSMLVTGLTAVTSIGFMIAIGGLVSILSYLLG